MRTNPGPPPPPYRKFIWNDYLLQTIEGFIHSRWILYIVCGFVAQISILTNCASGGREGEERDTAHQLLIPKLHVPPDISVFGRPIFLTLIARRSSRFAGTRFLKRGSNDEVGIRVGVAKYVNDIHRVM